ncbi:hypothetical protein HDU98_005893 [Podochytrium sp. JEL0797]|nr:hypothetical protein HDU98_005893 [Podochytrium sp. JEL0797]
MDEVYIGDKERRMRLLNTKIVQKRLKGLQSGSNKTEYLLALTLPPMIVDKLKEVGTGNFDLIAERFDLTSVMFTDIKNYKEVAHTISTRTGCSLLNTIFHHMDEVRSNFKNLERIKASTINSKMLLVGGLDKLDKIDHLLELIDMALIYRDMFQQEVTYGTDTNQGTNLTVKLDIAMGIHIGPLVAGIVGKKTFCYEVYGDVVNTASRMLAIAKSGQIIVTALVWERVQQEYIGTCIGEREVKGKGLMKVYCIERQKTDADLEMEDELPADMHSFYKPPPPGKRGRSSLVFDDLIKSSFGQVGGQVGERSLDVTLFASVMGAAEAMSPTKNGKAERTRQTADSVISPTGSRSSRINLSPSVMNLPSARQRSLLGNSRNAKVGPEAERVVSPSEMTQFVPSPVVSAPSQLEEAANAQNVVFNIDVAESLDFFTVQSASSGDLFTGKTAASNDTLESASGSASKNEANGNRYATLKFAAEPDIKMRRPSSRPSTTDMPPAPSNEYVELESESIIKRIAASSSGLSSHTALERVTSQEEVQSIKKEIAATFVTDKAKTILFLTTLATIGGYAEELTDEQHAILEVTGTLNFLKSDSWMNVVQESLTPFLTFVSKELELRYVSETNDKNTEKFWNFSVKGITCELIIIALAMISLYFTKESTLSQEGVVVPVLATIFIGTGSQVLIGAVAVAPERQEMSPLAVLLLGIWSAITLTAIVTIASMHFCGLQSFTLLVPLTLPQFPIVHTFMLDGISFFSKLVITVLIGIFFLFLNASTYVSYAPLLLIIPYSTIFHAKEMTVKTEYLMKLIALTQANLVREESEKSAHVLATILPKRIIMRLLEDPNTMFYEEFPMTTVLHMDIAGFTAMSARLEPLDVVKIFNNLFVYFDHLIETYQLEKITTIGDAYVASSNLAVGSKDARTSAISVCVVALQMQSFIMNHVNHSFLMRNTHKQTITMRIGIHSGPCYGAIMGGDKNFRYDLMGDTVINAEKIQEHCELAKVYISEATFGLVRDYHAFNFEETDTEVAGGRVFKVESDQF